MAEVVHVEASAALANVDVRGGNCLESDVARARLVTSIFMFDVGFVVVVVVPCLIC